MNFRTFNCDPFISHITFQKSYRIKIYLDRKFVYDEINNIWPDRNENDRIDFVNMLLDTVLTQPPLTKDEIVYHQLTKDP